MVFVCHQFINANKGMGTFGEKMAQLSCGLN
jgi:hypothetical protein